MSRSLVAPLSTVFRPRVPAEALPPDLRLSAAAWGVYFALTGRHTVAQVAVHLGLSPSVRESAFEALLEHDLVEEMPLSFEEYVRAAATLDETLPKSLAEFLSARPAPARPRGPEVVNGGASARPGAEPVPSTTSAATAPRTPAAATVVLAESRPGPPPALAFRPLPLPPKEEPMPEAPPPPERRLRLRSLIEFVIDRAASVEQGQLDVYRAFLRIDPKLLRRCGITTLRFEDERIVEDPELIERIEASVRETIDADLPAGLFG